MGDRFVGLIRVSTDEQGDSGLGLSAGRRDINEYISRNNGDLVTILEEVGSGGYEMIERPVLLRAIALCKRQNAILLVPKIDRLVRSTEVHTDLKRSGVPIRACDNPFANEFMLDVLVAFAANERRVIRKRTREGLQEYKQNKEVSEVQMAKLIKVHGPEVPPEAIADVAGKLGSHLVGCHLTKEARDKGRLKANERSQRKAVDVYEDLVPEIRARRESGESLSKLAQWLNESGERRPSGKPWTKMQVKRLLDRAKAS
jgi:DNA invertase Pin-like site-specific DNA recombinase